MEAAQLYYTSKNMSDSIIKNPATATKRLAHIHKGEETVKGKGQTSMIVTEGNK